MIKRRYTREKSRSITIVTRYNYWFLLFSFIFCLYTLSSFAAPVKPEKKGLEQLGIQNHGQQATKSKTEITLLSELDNNEPDDKKPKHSLFFKNLKNKFTPASNQIINKSKKSELDNNEPDDLDTKQDPLDKNIVGSDKEPKFTLVKKVISKITGTSDPIINKSAESIEKLESKKLIWAKELKEVTKLIKNKDKITSNENTKALHNLADNIETDIEKLQSDIALLEKHKKTIEYINNNKFYKLVVTEEIEPNELNRQNLQQEFLTKKNKYHELSMDATQAINNIKDKTWKEFQNVANSYDNNTYAYSEKKEINRELRANILYVAKVEMDRKISSVELNRDQHEALANAIKSLVENKILGYEDKLSSEIDIANKDLRNLITTRDKSHPFIASLRNAKKAIVQPLKLNNSNYTEHKSVPNPYDVNASSTTYGISDNEYIPTHEDLKYDDRYNRNASSNIKGTRGEKHVYATEGLGYGATNYRPLNNKSTKQQQDKTNNTIKRNNRKKSSSRRDQKTIATFAAAEFNSSSHDDEYRASTESLSTRASQSVINNKTSLKFIESDSNQSGQESQAKPGNIQVTTNKKSRSKKNEKKKAEDNINALINSQSRREKVSKSATLNQCTKSSDLTSSDDDSNDTSSDKRSRNLRSHYNLTQSDQKDLLSPSHNEEYAFSSHGASQFMNKRNKNSCNDGFTLEQKEQDSDAESVIKNSNSLNHAEQSGAVESSPVFKMPKSPVRHSPSLSVNATEDKIAFPQNLNKKFSTSNWSMGGISSGYESSTGESYLPHRYTRNSIYNPQLNGPFSNTGLIVNTALNDPGDNKENTEYTLDKGDHKNNTHTMLNTIYNHQLINDNNVKTETKQASDTEASKASSSESKPALTERDKHLNEIRNGLTNLKKKKQANDTEASKASSSESKPVGPPPPPPPLPADLLNDTEASKASSSESKPALTGRDKHLNEIRNGVTNLKKKKQANDTEASKASSSESKPSLTGRDKHLNEIHTKTEDQEKAEQERIKKDMELKKIGIEIVKKIIQEAKNEDRHKVLPSVVAEDKMKGLTAKKAELERVMRENDEQAKSALKKYSELIKELADKASLIPLSQNMIDNFKKTLLGKGWRIDKKDRIPIEAVFSVNGTQKLQSKARDTWMEKEVFIARNKDLMEQLGKITNQIKALQAESIPKTPKSVHLQKIRALLPGTLGINDDDLGNIMWDFGKLIRKNAEMPDYFYISIGTYFNQFKPSDSTSANKATAELAKENEELKTQLEDLKKVFQNYTPRKPKDSEYNKSTNSIKTEPQPIYQSKKNFQHSQTISSNHENQFNNISTTTIDEFHPSVIINALDLSSTSKSISKLLNKKALFATKLVDRQNLSNGSNNNEGHKIISNNTLEPSGITAVNGTKECPSTEVSDAAKKLCNNHEEERTSLLDKSLTNFSFQSTSILNRISAQERLKRVLDRYNGTKKADKVLEADRKNRKDRHNALIQARKVAIEEKREVALAALEAKQQRNYYTRVRIKNLTTGIDQLKTNITANKQKAENKQKERRAQIEKRAALKVKEENNRQEKISQHKLLRKKSLEKAKEEQSLKRSDGCSLTTDLTNAATLQFVQKQSEEVNNAPEVTANGVNSLEKESSAALEEKKTSPSNQDIDPNLNVDRDKQREVTTMDLTNTAIEVINPIPPAVVPYQAVAELFAGDELFAAINPIPPAVLTQLTTKFGSNQQLSLSSIGNSHRNDGGVFIDPKTEASVTITSESPLYSGIREMLLAKGDNYWTVSLPVDIGGGSVTVKLNDDGAIVVSGDRYTIDNVSNLLIHLARGFESNQQPQKDDNQTATNPIPPAVVPYQGVAELFAGDELIDLTNKMIDPLEEVKHKTNAEIFTIIQKLHGTQYDKERLLSKTKEIVLGGIKEAGSTLKELKHATMLFDAESGTEASKLIMDAVNFSTLTQATQAIRKNTALNTNVPDIIDHSINQITTRLHSRINLTTSKSNLLGKAAGDEIPINHKAYGAWAESLYNQGIKKGQKGLDYGYKHKLYGKIIGADTSLNDDMTTIGFAFAFINNNVKYNNSYKDKTKTDDIIFSFYGKQELTDSWFAQWIASYSSAKVEHQEERIFSFGNKVAQANYISKSYGGEILLGYEAKLNQTVLTPFTGISYIRSRDGGYRETGLPFANRTVAANNRDKVDVIAGARLSLAINTDTCVVIPEIHGMLSKRINGKADKMTAKIDGMNEPFTKITRTSNTMGNFGVGITAKSCSIEYGAGYGLQLANRYMGHQASLKVRINF